MKKVNVRLELTNVHVSKPERATTFSAGYDVFAPFSFTIRPFESYTLELPFLFTTDRLCLNEISFLFTPRSSYGIKKKLRLIDSTKQLLPNVTFDTISNQLLLTLYNDSSEELTIPEGEHFLQFILIKNSAPPLPISFEKVSLNTLAKNSPFPGSIHSKEIIYEWVLGDELLIQPQEQVMLPTGYKAFIDRGSWLSASIHSAYKDKLVFANGTPVIDADYYNNQDNEGHIFLAFTNVSDEPVRVPKGSTLCSFHARPFFLLSNDEGSNTIRTGGIGHTSN